MRILVAIASYGTNNDRYLQQLLEEYRSMPWEIDVVVLSNIDKNSGPDVEVLVGLPDKNPWSLPFGHKKLFAERANDYDLFLYSEDDILITTRTIQAFLEHVAILPEDQIPGFMRYEVDAEEKLHYCDVHAWHYWDVASISVVQGHTVAYFTNEHSACYMLTRQQLQRAIQSGGFLVPPHEGIYDLLCSAATDPYTQCGFKRVICLSHIEDFLVHHLANKYIGRFGIEKAEFDLQRQQLLSLAQNQEFPKPAIDLGVCLNGRRPLRDHYKPVRREVVEAVSADAMEILSFGCGETEYFLAKNGKHVTSIPVDPILSAGATRFGIHLLPMEIEAAKQAIGDQKFDVLLLLDVLHLIPAPSALLASLAPFLKPSGEVLVLTPNVSFFNYLLGWMLRKETRKSYHAAGVHRSSASRVRGWLRRAGFRPNQVLSLYEQDKYSPRRILRLIRSLLPRELLVRAHRMPVPEASALPE